MNNTTYNLTGNLNIDEISVFKVLNARYVSTQLLTPDGKIVMHSPSVKLDDQVCTITGLSTLNSGVYFLRININGKTTVRQLILD